jgi:hypothetical protein
VRHIAAQQCREISFEIKDYVEKEQHPAMLDNTQKKFAKRHPVSRIDVLKLMIKVTL